MRRERASPPPSSCAGCAVLGFAPRRSRGRSTSSRPAPPSRAEHSRSGPGRLGRRGRPACRRMRTTRRSITLELYAHGRRSRAQAQDTLVDVLIASLTGPPVLPGPVWRRAGVFPTWLDLDGADRANIVDCAVNANVLALMASLDERELPGFAEAVDMIVAAVDWCEQGGSGRAAKRADTIAPYYALSPRGRADPRRRRVVRRDRARGIPGPPGRSGRRRPRRVRLPCGATRTPARLWRCRALNSLRPTSRDGDPDPVS